MTTPGFWNIFAYTKRVWCHTTRAHVPTRQLGVHTTLFDVTPEL